jgi:hypothetical protein
MRVTLRMNGVISSLSSINAPFVRDATFATAADFIDIFMFASRRARRELSARLKAMGEIIFPDVLLAYSENDVSFEICFEKPQNTHDE